MQNTSYAFSIVTGCTKALSSYSPCSRILPHVIFWCSQTLSFPQICLVPVFASPLALSRSLSNLNVPMPSELILHTNHFSSFYLQPVPWLLFFPHLALFSNPVVISLSSFYYCVIVITYSSSSSNFELLSSRWAMFFSPNSVSHAHLGSSCFFFHFECLQFLSSQWMQRRVLMLCVQMNRICSWAPHGPQPSKLSESFSLCWLKLYLCEFG